MHCAWGRGTTRPIAGKIRQSPWRADADLPRAQGEKQAPMNECPHAVLSTNLEIREGHNMRRQDTAHSPAPVSTPESRQIAHTWASPHDGAPSCPHACLSSFRSEITRTTPRSTTLASAIIPVLQPRHSPTCCEKLPSLTFSPGQISECRLICASCPSAIMPVLELFFRWVIGSACLMNLSLRGRSSIGFRRRERLGRLPLPGPGLSPFG